MPTSQVELRFLVPTASRAAVSAEMERTSIPPEHVSSTWLEMDTPDRRLTRAGLAWRLHRSGRQWIQTLEATGVHAVDQFRHEAMLTGTSPDAQAHADTLAGKRLAKVLRRASTDGVEVGARLKTELRRTVRHMRLRGATVKVIFNEAKLTAGDSRLRLSDVEFERVSGTAAAAMALVERWRKRFDLLFEPRTMAQRGDRLADGEHFPPVRKSNRPAYSNRATATEALGAVLDECLAQITHNAVGLTQGDPTLKAEHVHQLRIGIRRLRSALRSFANWTPAPPPELVAGIKSLFSVLGRSRDGDVLVGGIATTLAQVGAPRLTLAAPKHVPDVARAVRDEAVQRIFLGWLAWRISLAEPTGPQTNTKKDAPMDGPGTSHGAATEPVTAPPEVDPRKFPHDVERRLRRWHRRIAADWKVFEDLDEASVHSLRKRIKRQRYAVEFFTPMLRRRRVAQYLKSLTVVQDRMGELNDLFVARAQYQTLVETSPEAWFALGWITARIAEVRAQAESALGKLARTDTP